jgi:hypothetical protein
MQVFLRVSHRLALFSGFEIWPIPRTEWSSIESAGLSTNRSMARASSSHCLSGRVTFGTVAGRGSQLFDVSMAHVGRCGVYNTDYSTKDHPESN